MSRPKKSISTPRLMRTSARPDPRLLQTLADEDLFADLASLYGHGKKPGASLPRSKKPLSTPRLMKTAKADPRLERTLAEEALAADLTYLDHSDKRPRAKINRRHKSRA